LIYLLGSGTTTDPFFIAKPDSSSNLLSRKTQLLNAGSCTSLLRTCHHQQFAINQT